MSFDELQMPEPEVNGFVKTLNKMGYMTANLDKYSQAFIAFAANAQRPVLDVGAAYGVATLAALAAGASVVANDMDERHLQILVSRAPAEYKDKLSIRCASFPDLELEKESLAAVLIARVLHFLDGETLERSAKYLLQWLMPGGKVFVVAETPYLKNFQAFVPVYEARREAGHKYPGLIEDVLAFAPERGKNLPRQMHLLDPEVLTRVFVSAGFVVEEAATFARPEFPEDMRFDGRESVGLIARKIA